MHTFRDDQLTCVCIGVACRANSGLKGELHAAAVWITITKQHAGAAQQRISFGGLFQACRRTCACGLLHHRDRRFVCIIMQGKTSTAISTSSGSTSERYTSMQVPQVLFCCLNEPFVDRNCAICPRFSGVYADPFGCPRSQTILASPTPP